MSRNHEIVGSYRTYGPRSKGFGSLDPGRRSQNTIDQRFPRPGRRTSGRVGPVLPDREVCLTAVRSRDARFDGRFYTAVSSTGIYCRPSCPAMTPRADRLTFYPSAAAAQDAGFRRPRAGPRRRLGRRLRRARRPAGHRPLDVELVAMRSLGDPDAFPATDLGVRRALAALGVSPAQAARWRPWRAAYATQYLWATLDHPINRLPEAP